ncbi:MAG TPA: ATP-binding protein [Actinospica sp.]|nr:ATP-binding protein [Actinospica sp.]
MQIVRALPGIPRNCTACNTGPDDPSPATGIGGGPQDWPSTTTDAPMALATPADTRGAAVPADFVRTAVFRLAPVLESAGRARRSARTMLQDWRLGHLVEDVDLVVSELVTNALLHTGAGEDGGELIRLELDLNAHRLTLRVVDSSPLPPMPEQAADTAESGRGLLLVEALAAEWDWEDLPDGKAVWAAFDL